MDELLARALADVRRAVALAHALPRCIIALETADGETVEIGFRRDRCGQGTPCDLREALHLVLTGLVPQSSLTMLGTPLDHVNAQLLVDDEDQHVGLGVYRYQSCAGQGYVLASLAPVGAIERRLRDVISELRARDDAIEHAEIRLAHDPDIEVSLVFVEFPPLPLLVDGCPEECSALAIAAACLAEELPVALDAPADPP